MTSLHPPCRSHPLRSRLWRGLLLFGLAVGVIRAADVSSDVLVYGGSASGVVAAVQAARMGKSVVLVEPGRHVGGLTASGLGMTDVGVMGTISGVSKEFYQRIHAYYTKPSAWVAETRQTYHDWMPAHWGVDGKKADELKILFQFEPKAAESVFRDMIREAGVKLLHGERLDLKNGVRKDGARIISLRMESGREFAARMFIDATYEGDVMAKAGVTYVTGREANAQYGETLNGILPSGPAVFKNVSPYVVAGDPKSGLLPHVEPKPPGVPGAADFRQQGYNFRICLTDVPANRVPIEKPADYNALEYEALIRWIGTLNNVGPGQARSALVALGGNNRNLGISFQRMPNRKTDSNIGSEFGSDYLGMSWDWADGDYALREKRWQQHKTYIQGLVWTLGHDPRIPESVRQEMQRWGLPKDEFTDNGHWPFQLYVREARRMVSDYVVTEHDARGTQSAEDPVALGSYHSDSHGVTYYVDEEGRLCREKGFYVRTGVFGISYRSIRPRAAECTNLLVPMCLSATHAAYGPTRMEPVFMMLGHAAGAAASLALDRGVTLQGLPYADLKARLLADGQVLTWKNAKPLTGPLPSAGAAP